MSSPTDLLRAALADLDLREAALHTSATDMEAECAQKLAGADTKIAADRARLDQDVQKAEQAKGKVEHDLSALRERVKLNVGGIKFVTTLNTLTKFPDTYFSTAFSGRHEVTLDAEGYFCIDRDGTHFRYILNWLRDGTFRALPGNCCEELFAEIRYYLLEDFLDPATRHSFAGVAQRRAKAAADAVATVAGAMRPVTREQIVRLVKQGAKVFPTLDYGDLDLSKIRFVDGTVFSGANLRQVDLSDSVLQHADLTSAQLEGANLRGADLSQCKFGQSARLAGADLSGAKLGASELQQADLRGALLTGATLDGANMTGAQLMGAQLEEASLVCADLSSAKATGANMRGCKLKGAQLGGAVLYGADLSGAQMQSTNLREAKLGFNYRQGWEQALGSASACLSAADLSGADLSCANLGRVDCSEALLVGAVISGADFSGANLYAASLTGVSLTGVSRRIVRCSFRCANFTNAIMTLDLNTVDTEGAVGLPPTTSSGPPTPDGLFVFGRTSR